MRTVRHQHPVFEAPDFTLVGVTDDPLRTAGFGTHCVPFHSGRETRTTTTSQAALLQLRNHLVRITGSHSRTCPGTMSIGTFQGTDAITNVTEETLFQTRLRRQRHLGSGRSCHGSCCRRVKKLLSDEDRDRYITTPRAGYLLHLPRVSDAKISCGCLLGDGLQIMKTAGRILADHDVGHRLRFEPEEVVEGHRPVKLTDGNLKTLGHLA